MLFKYRGQLPVIILVIAIPLISATSNYKTEDLYTNNIQYIGILISCIGFFFRCYIIAKTHDGTSGRNRNQQIAEKLNTTGVYSTTRHPLYLANYTIWLGISMYSISYILTIITSLFFFLVYRRIIHVEEYFLSKKYAKKHEDFITHTPIFFPSFKNYKPSKTKFSIKKILKQEYSSMFSIVIAFIYIDLLIRYFIMNTSIECGQLVTNKHLIILCISIIITVLLKLYKTVTK